ncbi:hypothetical protein [Streptomyces monashensis]|uniref:hypothetical protein n=1 Tax=Streptomyces monashensis TaxID=1678012 RepID=UPI001FE73B13|nr:hypothetical protein [Streptomyces monashensis]
MFAGQQPFHQRPVAGTGVVDGLPNSVGVHLAGGLRGLLGARRLVAQGAVTAHAGPQTEGAGLALVELGEQGEIGLGPLLVGAERVPELDEFHPQHVGLEVVRHDSLCDLSPPLRPPGRRPR